MLTRVQSRPYDWPEPPSPTTTKTLHEAILWKLGEQLRKRYEPAWQLPSDMERLVGRLDDHQADEGPLSG